VATVYLWFSLKTTTTVSWFVPQNQGQRFIDLSLKIIMVHLFSGFVRWKESALFLPELLIGFDLYLCVLDLISC
jgi:hypothetical protein